MALAAGTQPLAAAPLSRRPLRPDPANEKRTCAGPAAPECRNRRRGSFLRIRNEELGVRNFLCRGVAAFFVGADNICPRAGEGAGPYGKSGTFQYAFPRPDNHPREAPHRRGQAVLHPPTGGSRRDRAASAHEAPKREAGKPQVLMEGDFQGPWVLEPVFGDFLPVQKVTRPQAKPQQGSPRQTTRCGEETTRQGQAPVLPVANAPGCAGRRSRIPPGGHVGPPLRKIRNAPARFPTPQ